MNKKDKEKMLIVVFVLAFILIALAFIFGTRFIPVKWIVAIIIAIQALYLMPTIVKLYYQSKGYKIGLSRFIPVWNDLCIFPQKLAIADLITLIISLLAIACIFVPADIRIKLFGELFALNSGFYAIRVAAIFLVINNFIVGAGFSFVYRDIKRMLADLSKSFIKTSKSEYLCYVLLYLPVVRCAGLTMFLDKLNKLVVLNNYKATDEKNNVLQEEE